MKVVSVPAGAALILALSLGGCGGGGGNGGSGSAPTPANGGTTNLQVHVTDVLDSPLKGAAVSVTAAGSEQQQTTDADGVAEFLELPSGEFTVSVSASGFESLTVVTVFESGPQFAGFTLDAEGAWAIGRPIVLGTSLVERESDGSAISFVVDMALIDDNGEALQTLTSADFSVVTFDCGWGDPRDCASDAEGNPTGNFQVDTDGGAQAFELRPAPARHPYMAAVLVERSSDGCWNWDVRASALKSLFSLLSGNDVASLMTVQTENGASTLTVHGPFTNDGSMYLDIIDALDCSEANPPELFERLVEAIKLVATADGLGVPEVARHLVVVATTGLTPSEAVSVAELARESGVHISSIPGVILSYYYGLPEVAVRTGGFVSFVSDWRWRDADMVFGALDHALSGALPVYRMQFRLTGGEGTFVPGGNAKVHLRVDVPTPIPNRGIFAVADVPIP